METPSMPATLAYERQNEQLRAEETAAVWRVVWWIGVLWSVGALLETGPSAWMLLSGGWVESRLAELRFGGLSAAMHVINFAGAMALAGALLAGARRRRIAILATLMAITLLLSVIAGVMVGGVYYERSFHFVWLGAIVLRMLADGGIAVVAAVAWWPVWITAKRLFASVAVLLLGSPAGQVVDALYWWLARGEAVRQVLRDQFSWQGWPMMLEAGLLLLVSMLLLVMSPAMLGRRWLLRLAVFAAVLGIVLYDLLYLYRAFDVFWINEPFSQLLSMIAGNLQRSAPVLGLLFWRPQRDSRS